MENQKVLDVLNSLEVVYEEGGDNAALLVKSTVGNLSKLEEVGIGSKTALKYGDTEEKEFCKFALAVSEGYANDYENGKLVWKDERTLGELKSDIQVALDSPITEYQDLHDAIQNALDY